MRFVAMQGLKNKFMEKIAKSVMIPEESKEQNIKRISLLMFSSLMSMGGIIWGLICLSLGLYFSSVIPFAYTILVWLTTAYYIISKKYQFVSFFQISLSLILPFLLQWSLGGFSKSGCVMYWAIISPLAAQFFWDSKKSSFWVIAFSILTVISGYYDSTFSSLGQSVPESFRPLAFIVNIGMVSIIVFLVTYYFYREIEKTKHTLQNTLEEVQTLKVSQDGDYFLTSLLIKPLNKTLASSENVKITAMIKQKKSFEFKNKQMEIGGDINITHNILLKNRPYIFFVNGDAMGKSIQGAGGALVMGAVLQSVITRTKTDLAFSNQFPELWLKKVFLELHRTFESFDGSMLMSCIIGILDEEEGFMYYMNAEHPNPVLFRDGKSAFINKDAIFMKLGIVGLENPLHVHTFHLKPGDRVILGSDGRDDIMLKNFDGTENINYDENLFLEIVDEAGGVLEDIYDGIQNRGKLTDDTSLMIIEFANRKPKFVHTTEFEKHLLQKKKSAIRENRIDEAILYLMEVYNTNPEMIDVMHDLIRLYLKKRDYEQAIYYANRYLAKNPLDYNLYYNISIWLKRLKKVDEAISFGELFRLREPNSIRNLINLADLHLFKGNYKKSQFFIREILQRDPMNVPVQKIISRMNLTFTEDATHALNSEYESDRVEKVS